MFRHLKKKHSIDFSTNNIIEKKIRKKINIDIIIFREIEINIKTEKKKENN